ncbi:MAG: type II toxin-antitoxin system VapC family toxin [Nocardioides sp.]
MILYVDTSALVPLVVHEASSGACGELWDAAERVTTTRLAYIEAAAAFALAQRLGRISPGDAEAARESLQELWTVFDVVEIDEPLMASAARLARTHALRGYDATHCAAAVALNDDQVVAATGDLRLLAAWRAEELAVRDTNR